jgi:Lrp/AsnC family transcriptional regulator for asnA, asnC and gidA
MSSLKRQKKPDIVSEDAMATDIRTRHPQRAAQSARPVPGATARSQAPLIDDCDRSIIRLLQRDGRASNTEIGRALGLTETTIRKRVARLVSEGLISIVAVPTPQAVGMTTSAIIGISVQLQHLHEVSDQLVSLPEVRYVGASTGRYDLIIEAFFADHEHLLDFVSNELGAMSGVTAVETSLILKVAKFSYEWEIA